MATKSELAQQLGVVAGFENPRAPLEQYRTPPAVAASLIHTADLQGDIDGQTVVDLGCGTGMLGLAAALRGPTRVVSLDIDAAPLATAQENQRRVASTTTIDWIRADATAPPLCLEEPVTVVMNPPFGAQSGNEHADREFLETTAALATVSYSIHNAGSQSFVESFAADNGGTVTHAYAVELDVPRQFEFHDDEMAAIDAEAYRIEWERSP